MNVPISIIPGSARYRDSIGVARAAGIDAGKGVGIATGNRLEARIRARDAALEAFALAVCRAVPD